MLNSQPGAEFLPDLRGKLCPPVCRYICRNTKSADPPSTKASTAVVASRFFTGMASNHLVERSITVKMYLNHSGEVGSGPTKST
jgi:hypothetical protein